MKIVVFGLGYVGTTVTACLLRSGHRVVGIDTNARRAAAVGCGRSPITEPGVDELLHGGWTAGRLTAHGSVGGHLNDAEIAIVCAGTPGLPDGSVDLSGVSAVANEIGCRLRERPVTAGPLLCVFRSTMPAASMDTVVVPALASAAGEPPGARYEVGFNPEFFRESTAVADYFAPAKIVIGERTPGVTRCLRGLYEGFAAPVFEVSFVAAELIKLADNCWHALKVSFANEVGRLAAQFNVGGSDVMEPLLADTQLNVSPAYLRPGGPFGGSCLPRDVRSIVAISRQREGRTPVLDAILPSNVAHERFIARRVMAAAPAGGSILLLGLTFKSGTDDVRESPLVTLAATLRAAGYRVRIHDPDLRADTLDDRSRKSLDAQLPDFLRLLVDDPADAAPVHLVVVGKPLPEALARVAALGPVLDLSRL